jgi:phage portal protein BeeE
MPLEDAQFIETRSSTTCASRSSSGSRRSARRRVRRQPDVQQRGDAGHRLVRWSLRRWLIRIENSLLRDPSMFLQGQRFYPEFLVDGLLRADTKTRYDAYKIALDGQFLTVDEVRELENRACRALPPATTDPRRPPMEGRQ